jgi:hypothetical protein
MARHTRVKSLILFSSSATDHLKGVAYAIPGPVKHGSQGINIEEIDIIDGWGSSMTNHDKIPSVISYSNAENPKKPEEQWGADISDKAVAMLNTKLELDVQDNKTDELELTLQALDGMGDLNFSKVKEAHGYVLSHCCLRLVGSHLRLATRITPGNAPRTSLPTI